MAEKRRIIGTFGSYDNGKFIPGETTAPMPVETLLREQVLVQSDSQVVFYLNGNGKEWFGVNMPTEVEAWKAVVAANSTENQ